MKNNKKPRSGYKGRNYNVDFFRKILTEVQAYWLGFFFADGFITPSKGTVGITLAFEDFNHLLKLALSVGLDASAIKIYKRSPGNWQVQDSVRLLFARRPFYESFLELGYSRRKADRVQFPDIPAHLLRHFIRGMFDGDGYVNLHISKGKYKDIARFHWGLSVANEQFAQLILRTLREATGEHIHLGRDHSIWRVNATNQVALIALYRYLYEDATVFLERKHNKFLEAINFDRHGNQSPAA